jgi:hypothetical protein
LVLAGFHNFDRRTPLPVSVNFDPLSERMRKLRAPQDLIARLTGLPAMAISRAANHQSDLCYADWRRVETVIADLEELCRRAGLIVDWRNHEVLKEKLAQLEDERQNPPEFPTETDWKLLRAISSGQSFVDIATEMGCTTSQLFGLLEAANKRITYQAAQLSSWTHIRKAHTDLVEKEMADRSQL